MSFWTRASNHVFPKRSAKIIEGTEKNRNPSKFVKLAARNNEFRYNSKTLKVLGNALLNMLALPRRFAEFFLFFIQSLIASIGTIHKPFCSRW